MLSSGGSNDGLNARLRARERKLVLKRARLASLTHQSCVNDTSVSGADPPAPTLTCQALATAPSQVLRA
eukprot:4084731-Pleurochrysis_carterae.AAC.1